MSISKMIRRNVMRKVIRKMMVLCAAGSILTIALVVYAADSDILNFLPAIVKAQESLVGTYKGSAKGTYGTCACAISDMTITIADGPVSGTYIVGYSIDSSNVQCGSNCSMNYTLSNVPGVAIGNEVNFAYVHYSTWIFDTPVQMLSNFDGKASLSNGQLQFVTKSTNAQIEDMTSGKRFTTVVGGTLTKQ